jgi:threonine synthase
VKFVSTRGQAPQVSVTAAIDAGLAPDGGLYVPEKFPLFDLKEFDGVESFPEIAYRVLKPFFSGDPLESKLKSICARAFDFPIPLKELKNATSVLELFHGPTSAFKDVGARFIAECLVRSGAHKTIIAMAYPRGRRNS